MKMAATPPGNQYSKKLRNRALEVLGVPLEALSGVADLVAERLVPSAPAGRAKLKLRGAVYTPRFLSDHVVRGVLDGALSDLSGGRPLNRLPPRVAARVLERLASMKFLDPCCGVGSFVLSLVDVYLERFALLVDRAGDLAGLPFEPSPEEALRRFLSRQVAGCDLDAGAIDVARAALRARAASLGLSPGDVPAGAFEVGNGLSPLRGLGGNEGADATREVEELAGAFDWRSTFPSVLDGAGGFDAVVGNPPYVANKAVSPPKRLARHGGFSWCVYNADLYVAFVQHALENLLVPGGRLGFVLSNKWLSQNYGRAMTRALLRDYAVESLLDLEGAKPFRGVNVEAVVLVVKKSRPVPGHRVTFLRPILPRAGTGSPDSLGRAIERGRLRVARVPLERLRVDGKPAIKPRLAFSPKLGRFVRTISSRGISLERVAYFREGVKIHSKTYPDPSMRKPKSHYLHRNDGDGALVPVVDQTRAIRPYWLDWTPLFLDYRPEEHLSPAFPELFRAEKLLVTNVGGDQVRAAWDRDGRFFASHNVICVVKWDRLPEVVRSPVTGRVVLRVDPADRALAVQYDYAFLLGVLNSNVTGEYFRAVVGDGVHVYPKHLRALRVPRLDSRARRAVASKVSRDVLALVRLGPGEDATERAAELKLGVDRRLLFLFGLSDDDFDPPDW
ncbi:MAG: hypothetical protein Kow0069_35950 [Promethearchaeota archaeon]